MEKRLESEFVAFLKEQDEVRPTSILFEKDYYYEFSNFHILKFPIEHEGISYPTTEHFYQAMKTKNLDERRMVASLASPSEAKKMGKKISLREDWDDIKYDVMYHCVKQKFESDEELKELLLGTRDRWIIEWTFWGDEIWGMHSLSSKGCNALGKILMRVRRELSQTNESQLMKRFLGSVNQPAVDGMCYHLRWALRNASDQGDFSFSEAIQICKEALDSMPKPKNTAWSDPEDETWVR